MTAYLIANKPRQTQYRPRRAKPTGCIVIHTAESSPDTVGPDDGTMNVAEFIRDRTDYGSYHMLADSDSRLLLVPFRLCTYGDATGSNEFAIHISAATQAARWPNLPKEWRDGCVRQMAKCAARAARWLKRTHGITVPARRISKAQSDAGAAGFISHAERDPDRRSDPGKDFPWKQFLRFFDEEMAKDEEVAEPNEEEVLNIHLSMQFSDTPKQMEFDSNKLFRIARRRGAWWVTGTEAGGATLREKLRTAAKNYDYRIFIVRDVWIAVDKARINGGWETGYEHAIDSSEGVGKHTDKGVGWVRFNNKTLGTVSIGAGHYLTKGRQPGDPNYELNKRFAGIIGDWAKEHGKGTALAFYNGDQNIPDNRFDTFFGSPLTSVQDELGEYENTGHGPIDVMASYDRDARVRAISVNWKPDREVFFHTDHFIGFCVWGVQPKE